MSDVTDRAKGAVEAGVRQVRDATSDLAGKSNALQDQAASIVDSRAQQVRESHGPGWRYHERDQGMAVGCLNVGQGRSQYWRGSGYGRRSGFSSTGG